MLLFRQEEEAHTRAIGSSPRTARAPFLQCLSLTGRICVTLANTADQPGHRRAKRLFLFTKAVERRCPVLAPAPRG